MSNLSAMINPFRDSVVQDAWQSPADVPAIHQDVFGACLEGIDSAKRGRGDSLLIYGPAGSGKTHLLTRLQRYMRDNADAAPDRVLYCIFVFVRLQTSPRLIWQHVRRRLASDLLRKDEGLTQLQRLIAHQLAAQRGDRPTQWVRALRVLSRSDGETVAEHLAHISSELGLPRDIHVVLEHLTVGRFVMDAAAWLAGDSLPEFVLERLGLSRNEPEDREDAARQVVTALCRLAGTTLPIVFCFDQIEALQQTPDDREALFSFGRMAADLHDAGPDVVLISCIQSAVVDILEAGIRDADKERAFRRRAVLAPLSRAEVAALVIARLDLVAELSPLRETTPLHPFDDRFIDELAKLQPCVPRRVLAASAGRFEALRDGKSERDADPEAFLRAELKQRYTNALSRTSPEQTASILVHGVPLYLELGRTLHERAAAPSPASQRRRQGIDFMMPGPPLVAVSVRNETNMNSLAAQLRGLLESAEGTEPGRIVVVRDPRLPISRSARKTREYLLRLERSGVRLIQPSPEAIAALAALTSLLSDAKAGDLASGGEALSEATVRVWLQQVWSEDPRIAEVSEFVGEITAEPSPAEAGTLQDVAEVLARSRIIAVDEVAREIGRSSADVLVVALANPDRFGLLQGPPAVLIDLTGTALELELEAPSSDVS